MIEFGVNEFMSRYMVPILFIIGLFCFGTGLLLAQAEPGPGIASEITDVTIGDDTIPTVTFTLSDANGGPLTLDDVDSVRFLIARIDEDDVTGLPRYYNYFSTEVEGAPYQFEGETLQPALASASQPTFENGEGTFIELEPGVYTYTFAQALGDDFNARRTHVVAAEVIRGPRSVAANPIYAFVPDGSEPDDTRFLVETASCNNCHGQLSAHGGSRVEANMCGLCHNPDNVDPETGNSLDFRVLIHRIHDGENLPSVQDGQPYYIVGHGGSINDFSTVAFPQDVRNCTTCHTGPDYERNLEASVPTCTSCHDNVDPTIALNHPGRPKEPDSCGRCHYPDMEEFDNELIPGAHVIPQYSSEVAGVNLELVSVENAAPGQSPTVTLRVTNNAGDVIAPADMDYLAVTLAGPTTDYTHRVTETIYRSSSDASNPAAPPAVEDAGDGAFSYTMNYVLPEDATGTYGMALEGYVMEQLKDVDEPVRIAGFNPVSYVNLDGGEPDARRQVVALDNCNSCHKDLALHGGIRQNTEYCVMCHNPLASDELQRPADSFPPVSIDFPLLVHRIHHGDEASNPLIVYGFGGSVHNFGEVRFPGNLQNCATCHVDSTYNNLPALETHSPILISQGDQLVTQIQPVRAVCISCHDTAAADGHAELQTTASDVETCTVCHGPDREFALDEIHP